MVTLRFSEAFRAVVPAVYSPTGKCPGDPMAIVLDVDAPSASRSAVFGSSTTLWALLDGYVIRQNGYGFGSSSWTTVKGFRLVRYMCVRFDVTQPRRFKAEDSVPTPEDLYGEVADQLADHRRELEQRAIKLLTSFLTGDGYPS
jgi:hypothetical protein